MYSSTADGERPERRSEPRRFIDVPPILLETAEVTEQVKLVNLAPSGLLAQTRLQYEPGQALLVHFTGVQAVRARVAWWSRGMVGATFAERLATEHVAAFCLGEFHPDLISPTAESLSNR